MADIMNKGKRLSQIFVQLENICQRAGDLRHFNGVCQAIAEMVAQVWRKDLRLGFQTAKSAGVYDAVAVPAKGTAIGMIWFRVNPSPALCRRKPKVRQHAEPARLLRRELRVHGLCNIGHLGLAVLDGP